MKIKKGFSIGIIAIILIVITVMGSSIYKKNRNRRDLAERIFSEGSEAAPELSAEIRGRSSSPETISELRNAIATYEGRMERHVQDAAKTGTYWKILAIRLQDRGLHGEALEALECAIYYAPLDPAVHYYTGISAGIMAKSIHSFPGRENERDKYFMLAEEAYLRAIELDSRYLRPRYGLGVLYVFELDRPEDAIVHLERCLEISRNDVDTMFVLARAYYMVRQYQDAIDLYDRIITLSRDEQKRIDAQNNRQLILGQMYG